MFHPNKEAPSKIEDIILMAKHETKQHLPWDQIKNLVNCKQIQDSKLHHPIYSSCTKTDVVHVNGSTRITNKLPQKRLLTVGQSGGCGAPYTGKGILQFRKISGCYECRSVVDPSRFPLPRSNIFRCSQCGQVFPKIESLDLHQAVNHAVSELDADDSSRNIVEIIFKKSWFKPQTPICQIQRILKVHNTPRTIQRFEDHRAAVKLRAKRNPRCAADGNELLRFHAATLACSLGASGSTALCGSAPACGVCTIIRHGFQSNKTSGVRTTAGSGRADDCLGGGADARRAMLVCRVIAGRVKPRVGEDGSASADGTYDSLAGCAGVYSSVEELYVFSSRAILPCFVVIYNCKALDC